MHDQTYAHLKRQVYARGALLGLVAWSLWTARRSVGLLALAVLALDAKHLFLPFLGSAAVPWSLFTASKAVQDADVSVRIPTQASGVVFWAAEPGKHATPQAAYGQNAGVALARGGYAEVAVRSPGLYPQARNRRHVHYRELAFGTDVLGPVKTVFV